MEREIKMRQQFFGALALVIGLGLVACEPANNANIKSGDGRQRLSVNNSYGEFGDYVVHVNAMTTAGLTPEIAKGYGIVRSNNVGLINLVVLKKSSELGQDKPIQASVSLSAANPTGQLKSVDVREIEDSASIYYIGEVSVDDKETINFDLDIIPEGGDRTLLVRFSHQFYTR